MTKFFASKNRNFWAWMVLGIAVLAASVLLSYFSPIGSWRMIVFGEDIQGIDDPISWYLYNGFIFFDTNYPQSVMHPGLTLTFLIQIGTLVFYWVASAFGVSASYEMFVSKNLVTLAFFAKILITIMYIVSFVLLFFVALRLLEKRRYALIAVVGYATTFNVLFYHNIVNVDPIAVSYTLLVTFKSVYIL